MVHKNIVMCKLNGSSWKMDVDGMLPVVENGDVEVDGMFPMAENGDVEETFLSPSSPPKPLFS